jgi:hypothetical protein
MYIPSPIQGQRTYQVQKSVIYRRALSEATDKRLFTTTEKKSYGSCGRSPSGRVWHKCVNNTASSALRMAKMGQMDSQILDRIESERQPKEEDGSTDLRSYPMRLSIRCPPENEHPYWADDHPDLRQDELTHQSMREERGWTYSILWLTFIPIAST